MQTTNNIPHHQTNLLTDQGKKRVYGAGPRFWGPKLLLEICLDEQVLSVSKKSHASQWLPLLPTAMPLLVIAPTSA